MFIENKIVTLCGSTKFMDEVNECYEGLTMSGNIVFPFMRLNVYKNYTKRYENKSFLRDLHFKKIDLSEAIFVINKNKYIGEDTKIEIEYAKSKGKEIYYLED